MATLAEPSSSLSFTSSSNLSNGSIVYTALPPAAAPPPPAAEAGASLEVVSLSKLSSNLERLLRDSNFDCSDAEIVVEGAPVGIHRCILAARSRFFHDLFSRGGGGCRLEGGKPKYQMSELVPFGRVGREAFMNILCYIYTGKLKPAPPEVSVCVDPMCVHDACRPAVNFVVELMFASSVFQISELVSLFQVIKGKGGGLRVERGEGLGQRHQMLPDQPLHILRIWQRRWPALGESGAQELRIGEEEGEEEERGGGEEGGGIHG